MSLDRYRLLAQLGAGPDGISYRAVAEDGQTTVEVRDVSRARDDAGTKPPEQAAQMQPARAVSRGIH